MLLPYGGAEEDKLELRVVVTESFGETVEETEIAHFVEMKICVQNSGREWKGNEAVIEREREKRW